MTIASENGVINFRAEIFNPSIVNLRIVYTITFLFAVTLFQMEIFAFLEKSYENTYVFCCKDV